MSSKYSSVLCYHKENTLCLTKSTSTLANDGTNACAFLSVKIVERILGGLTGEDSYQRSRV